MARVFLNIHSKEGLMKKIAFILPVSLFFVTVFVFPDLVLAKKGGKGNGGGYSEDGIFYHSHSDRSYSGKEHFKGKGHAYGRMRNKDDEMGSPHGHGGPHHPKRIGHAPPHLSPPHQSISYPVGTHPREPLSPPRWSSPSMPKPAAITPVRFPAGTGSRGIEP